MGQGLKCHSSLQWHGKRHDGRRGQAGASSDKTAANSGNSSRSVRPTASQLATVSHTIATDADAADAGVKPTIPCAATPSITATFRPAASLLNQLRANDATADAAVE